MEPRNLSTRQRGARPGGAAVAAKADKLAADLAPILHEMQAAGALTPADLAAGLNERGILAPLGGRWSPKQVRRLLKRVNGG